jgi:hypothetical protein
MATTVHVKQQRELTRLAVALCLAVATALSVPHTAQAQLSSPLGEGAVAKGSGAGYHSPSSPFAPLVERSDVLPWSMLTAVKTKADKNRVLPVFGANLQALNQKNQRIQGFMMPLDPGEKQKPGVRSPAYDKFVAETLPNLRWEAEVDIFKAGDEKGAAIRMLAHIEDNLSHESAPKWAEDFVALLQIKDSAVSEP